MTTKVCRQCGEIKPIEQFRKYYGGRKGTYNTCKFCEKINSREKYLSRKESSGTITEAEQEELHKIHELWRHQMTLGLKPPRFAKGKSTPISESLDDLVAKYAEQANAVKEVTNEDIPAELAKWLVEELTEEPEYYQEEIYEALRAKYRPQIRIDKDTMLPVYDDTYRKVLQDISARFDEYEDSYYGKDK
jgi:hypothetical protein